MQAMNIINWLTSGSPEVWVAEMLILIALGVLLVVMINRQHHPDTFKWNGANRYQKWVSKEKRMANRMRFSFNNWIALRIVFFVLCFGFGFLTGIPILMIIGAGLGIWGLNLVLATRISSNQLSIERIFLGELKGMRDQNLNQGVGLDKALYQMADSCDPYIADILAPLKKDIPVEERLMEVAEAGHSPFISNVCGALMVVRLNDPDALRRILDDNLIPLGEAKDKIGDEAHKLLVQQFAYMVILTVLISGFLLFSQRVSDFHNFYITFLGQSVLVAEIAIFGGVMWFISKVLSVPPGLTIDIKELSKRMGRGA